MQCSDKTTSLNHIKQQDSRQAVTGNLYINNPLPITADTQTTL